MPGEALKCLYHLYLIQDGDDTCTFIMIYVLVSGSFFFLFSFFLHNVPALSMYLVSNIDVTYFWDYTLGPKH